MSLRVLIVEDGIFTRLELEMILAEAGHEVVGSISRAGDAPSIAADAPIDPAIVDLGLSDGDSGLNLAKRLHEDHEVPSILISGLITASLKQEVAEMSLLGMISKPFNKRFITAALDGLSARLAPAA